MPQTDPRRLAAWVAAGLILALLAAWYLSRSRPTAVAAAGHGDAQTPTWSRRAARRFSPMPETWSSSATDVKPPCCSR